MANVINELKKRGFEPRLRIPPPPSNPRLDVPKNSLKH